MQKLWSFFRCNRPLQLLHLTRWHSHQQISKTHVWKASCTFWTSEGESCHHQTFPWLSRIPFEKKTFWTQMLQQTLSWKIESFGRKSLTPHVNLKRKTSITCKSFITQAWNFTWNLQQWEKLSLTHLKLHAFNNSKSFLPHTSNFQWVKKLSSTHFHLKTKNFQKLEEIFSTPLTHLEMDFYFLYILAN